MKKEKEVEVNRACQMPLVVGSPVSCRWRMLKLVASRATDEVNVVESSDRDKYEEEDSFVLQIAITYH